MEFTSFGKDTKNTPALTTVSTLITSSNYVTNLNYSNIQNDQISMGKSSFVINCTSDENKESASGTLEDLNIYSWPDEQNSQMQGQNDDIDDIDNFVTEACNINDRPNTDGAVYSVSVLEAETESMDALDFCRSPALLASDSWFQACSLTAARPTTTLRIGVDSQEQQQEEHQQEEYQEGKYQLQEHQQEEHQQEELQQQEPERKLKEEAIIDSSVYSNNNTEANQQLAAAKSFIRIEQRPEKPLHYCSVCGKGLSDRGKLQDHMMIHTGEKPFSCSICNKSFRQKNHLTRHTTTHSEEKPFSCTICGSKFRQKTSLNQHIKTHTKPFSCTNCDRSFSRKYDLTKHVERANCSESRQRQSSEPRQEQKNE